MTDRTRTGFSGADPGFQVRGGGGALKKIAPSAGRRENCWGIPSEKSRFYAKKSIFFPILVGACSGCAPPPPGSAPGFESCFLGNNMIFLNIQIMKMFVLRSTVRPVLRGHLCDQAKMVS